jgi:thioesterase domain-containing protein
VNAVAPPPVVDLAVRDLSPAELDRTPLIGFHLSGTWPPLFAVRTWSEEVESYRRLAEQLGPEQPIYTVSPPTGEKPADFPTNTEAWADFCMDRFGALLARPQVALMGWSYAGVVALRIAERLAQRGAEIPLVALVDSTLPRKKPWGSSVKRSELHHFFVMGGRMFELDDPRARRAFFLRYARKLPKRWFKKAVLALTPRRGGERSGSDPNRSLSPATTDGAAGVASIADRGAREQRMPLLMRAIRIAYLKHEARPTTLPVALYFTEESRRRTGDTALGWTSVLEGDVEVVRVAGTHHTIFAPGHVESLAPRLAQSLRYAWERAAGGAVNEPRAAQERVG